MPNPLRVALPDERFEAVVQYGRERQAFAASRGYVSRYCGHNDYDKCESDHIIGALGESATAHAHGWTWKPNVGILDAADLAVGVEVRSRRIPGEGVDLALMQHDRPKAARPFVLAHVHVETPQVIDLMGWIRGIDGMKRRYWHDLERYKPHGVCFVPPAELNDVRFLRQVVEGKAGQLNVLGDHLCGCGAYGPFGELTTGRWYCREHWHDRLVAGVEATAGEARPTDPPAERLL